MTHVRACSDPLQPNTREEEPPKVPSMTLHAGQEVAAPKPLWATDRSRWALLTAAVALLTMAPFVATHPTSLSDLKDAVAAGAVTRVVIADPLPVGATGFATPEIRWEQGGITHATQVTQVSDRSVAAPSSQSSTDVVVGGAQQYLRSLPGGGPDRLTIVEGTRVSSGSILGWQVPVWFALTSFLLWLLTLTLVIGGPTPWRATRWAWFWCVVSPVALVGVPAYLALSGRLPRGASKRPERRVTGGWVFAAMLLLSGIVSNFR